MKININRRNMNRHRSRGWCL